MDSENDASIFNGEAPVDFRPRLVAAIIPSDQLRRKYPFISKPSLQTLVREDALFDFLPY